MRLIELFIEIVELCRYYTTRLWIGTPPQMFALIVDTGSTVTYVPCSTCEQCGRHQVMIRCVFSPFLLDSCVHSLTLCICKWKMIISLCEEIFVILLM